MGLFDRFRRHPIRDPAALGAFVDEQSLLLAQASTREYARQRAGAGADALLADAALGAALDRACWEAYPRALAMTGAVVEALLRPHARENAHAVIFGLGAAILEGFDRRAVPQAIREADWRAARAELTRSLNDLAHQRPKTVETVVQDHASFYLAIMPLHEKLAGDDFPMLRRLLKSRLAQLQEQFVQRADSIALVAELASQGQAAHSVEAG